MKHIMQSFINNRKYMIQVELTTANKACKQSMK